MKGSLPTIEELEAELGAVSGKPVGSLNGTTASAEIPLTMDDVGALCEVV